MKINISWIKKENGLKQPLQMNMVSIGGEGIKHRFVGFTRRNDGLVSVGNMRKPGKDGACLMIPHRGEFPVDSRKK